MTAGVGQGVSSLSEGQYEQATRELTPAALMVALYAGGKGLQATRGLQGLGLRLEELKATTQRLRGQLGGEGLEAVARYLRADPEAALLVIDGGEAGAAALYEARGNVPKAQAWYLDYGKGRVADLQRGTKVKHGRPLEPPLKWEGYQQMRGLWLRGLAFERTMAKLLREDAALPRAQRRFLQDFNEPRVEAYVGVHKPKAGLRFADVLVIEQKPLPGQPPRVETFSFKSRDFSVLKEPDLRARMVEDARQALEYYGETLDIRRPGLELRVEVQRVRLIYEGGELKPPLAANPDAVMNRVQKDVPGVEVFFQ